jgi:hypothetical protein
MVTKLDTDIVFVCYPPFAGGKFLINCLGLSNDASLQNSKLLNLPTVEKFNILMSSLQNITDSWDDLNLGCKQLYGLSARDIQKQNISKTVEIINNKLNGYSGVCFLVIHTPEELSNAMHIWSKPRIVIFKNTDTFIKHRLGIKAKLKNYWDTVSQKDWPVNAPTTVDEYIKLPQHIYNDLEVKHSNKIYEMIMCYDDPLQQFHAIIQDNDVNYWDTEWYFSKINTIIHINKLYKILKLPSVDNEYIEMYYDKWTHIMEKLK